MESIRKTYFDSFCRAFEQSGTYSRHLPVDFGLGLNVARVKGAIDAHKPDWVCLVQNETATGVANDVKGIAAYAKQTGVKVLVDAVSSLGGFELDMDGWGIDACISAWQKSLGAPGLGVCGLE